MTVFNFITADGIKRNYEKNDQPSLTDGEFYEPLSEMIPRIIRGELPPSSAHRPYYEFNKGEDSDDIFDGEDLSDGPSDLTDIDLAQEIINRASRASKEKQSEDAPAGPPEENDKHAEAKAEA